MKRYWFFSCTLACLLIFLLFISFEIGKDRSSFSVPEIPITNTEQKKVQIMLTGDVMLGRSVMQKSFELSDYSYPFRKVADILKNADLVFINLENPVVKNCPFSDSGFIFCTRPEMLQGLTLAGIDIANIANNHTENYGEIELSTTTDYLKKIGIDVVGFNDNLVVKLVDGISFGFLGFDFTITNPVNTDYQLIIDSAKKVDVLIIGVHWGQEYKANANKSQREWADKMVRAGAEVMVGTHPHWVQESEDIDGKPVYYSLGNFIFDQMWSEETKKGLLIRLTYQGKDLVKEEKLPIYMSSFAQPEFVK